MRPCVRDQGGSALAASGFDIYSNADQVCKRDIARTERKHHTMPPIMTHLVAGQWFTDRRRFVGGSTLPFCR